MAKARGREAEHFQPITAAQIEEAQRQLQEQVAIDEVNAGRLFKDCQIFEAVRAIHTGTVYVAGYERFVKIGFTSGSVALRVEALQTGSPIKIEVIWQCPGSFHLERRMHERFKDLRAQGEWFRRESDLAAWIDGGCRL